MLYEMSQIIEFIQNSQIQFDKTVYMNICNF